MDCQISPKVTMQNFYIPKGEIISIQMRPEHEQIQDIKMRILRGLNQVQVLLKPLHHVSNMIYNLSLIKTRILINRIGKRRRFI
jgi:hypothetical protein